MNRAATILISMIVGVVVFQAPTAGGRPGPNMTQTSPTAAVTADETPTTPPVSLRPNIVVTDPTLENNARVAEAVDRFIANGLALPDLDIAFFDDSSSCDDALGRFQRQHSPWRIKICSDLDFVITHELAHAWENANLSDKERNEYLELRGLDAWNDPASDRNERGTEDAAFVIQKSLMTTNPPDSATWRDRIEAFERLTNPTHFPVDPHSAVIENARVARVL